MQKRVVAVGVDLSPPSDLAALQAQRLARHLGAELVLIHVGYVPEPLLGSPQVRHHAERAYYALVRDRLTEDRERLEALRQRLLGQGVEISHVVVQGHFPDTAITKTARELDAELIVVGTQGRTGFDRWWFGSVAETTVRAASSSVLVARGGPEAAEGGYRTILVGTDFSSLAEHAMARALDVAAKGAQIRVLHAWHMPGIISPESVVGLPELRDAVEAGCRDQSQTLLRAWRERATGFALDGEVLEGRARDVLVDRATALGADLIVVGSHGRRGVRHLLLGSVAEAVVRHAPCSVLVARGPEAAAASG